MISFLKHAAQNLVVLLSICFSLVACKTTIPIDNGANISGISGSAGSEKTYSVTIPEGVQGLLIEVSGNSGVSIDLVDETDVSLNACASSQVCLLTNPAAATYKVLLTSTEDYEDVNLSASWGGPDQYVISNAVTLVDLAGGEDTVLLKSFYVGFNRGPVQLQSSGLENASIEIRTAFNSLIQECDVVQVCSVDGIESGLYFVRVHGQGEFADGTLSLEWGSASAATLQNGIPKSGISGSAGERHYETFFIPEGVDAFAVQVHEGYLDVNVVDGEGNSVTSCYYGVCAASDVDPGLYYVELTFYEDRNDIGLAVAWAGEDVGTFDNGELKRGYIGVFDDKFIEAFYVPEEATAFSVAASLEDSVWLEVYDRNGELLGACYSWEVCAFNNLDPGAYFLQAIIDSDVSDFSLSVAWSGPGISTLSNGVPKRGLIALEHEVSLQSLYISEGIEGLAVSSGATETSQTFTEVFDSTGNQVAYCYARELCLVEDVSVGPYFVKTSVDAGNANYSISAAWAGPDNSGLQNGISSAEFFGQRSDQHVLAFYIPEGVEAAMFSASYAEIFTQIVKADTGEVVSFCMQWDWCHSPYIEPGVYFAKMIIEADLVNYRVAVAWAGPEIFTLGNGESKSDDHLLVQSLYVPEDVEALMLSTGIEDTYMEVVGEIDYQECDSRQPCLISSPSSGVYFVRIRNEELDSSLNVSAAWAGPNVSTLQNGSSIWLNAPTQNSTSVQSVYLQEGIDALLLGVSLQDVEITFFDSNNTFYNLCYGGEGCGTWDLPSGSYFINIRVFGDEEPNFNVSAAWAGSGISSLTNGGIIGGISGSEGEVIIQSLYVSENAEAIMVNTSEAEIRTEIYDLGHHRVTDCFSDSPCIVWDATDQVYFVKTYVLDPVDVEFSLSAAWAGPGISTLENGSIARGIPLEDGDIVLQSIYLPENVSAAMLANSYGDYHLSVLDIYATSYADCIGSGLCLMNYPSPGAYFIKTVGGRYGTPEYSLSTSWIGEGVTSLANGETKVLNEAQFDEVLLYSLTVEQQTNIDVLTSSVPHRAELFSTYGEYLQNCSAPCTMEMVDPGDYFLHLVVDEPTDVLEITVNW